MKDFNTVGFNGKTRVLEVGFHEKTKYSGDCLKKGGGGAWTVCRFMGGTWQERGSGVFEGVVFSLLKQTSAQVFSCEFYGIFKNIFFIEHWWLLPKFKNRFLKKKMKLLL